MTLSLCNLESRFVLPFLLLVNKYNLLLMEERELFFSVFVYWLFCGFCSEKLSLPHGAFERLCHFIVRFPGPCSLHYVSTSSSDKLFK